MFPGKRGHVQACMFRLPSALPETNHDCTLSLHVKWLQGPAKAAVSVMHSHQHAHERSRCVAPLRRKTQGLRHGAYAYSRKAGLKYAEIISSPLSLT